MSEQMISMKIDGLEELQDAFEDLVKKYPDKAGDMLRKDARQLRKEIVKEVKKAVKTDTNSKRSLGKLSSYEISDVKGLGIQQFVEVSAKSPHFHLVEHGHNLVKDGVNIGFVQGRHMMDKAVKTHEENMQDTVLIMIDDLLKEGGLL